MSNLEHEKGWKSVWEGPDAEKWNKGRVLCDGSVVPYIEKCEDNLSHIIYNTSSEEGYGALPIWGVRFNEHLYQIFIGERPHKNEKGKWTVDNPNVISFIIGAFYGAHHIDKEPDKPHLIDICVEAYNRFLEDKAYRDIKRLNAELYTKTFYITFKDFWKALKFRYVQNWISFKKYNGERIKLKSINFGKKFKKLERITHEVYRDKTSRYFTLETENNIYWLYTKKAYKWGIHFEKTRNGHDYCSC